MNLKRSGMLVGLIGGGIISLIFITGFLVGAAFDRRQVNSSYDVSDPEVQNFMFAYHLVTHQSYFRPFDKHRLLKAAIDGMLNATGDPHTVFLSPPQNQRANQDLNGTKFSGIGAIVVPMKGTLQIVSPVPGSPSARAGLLAGDMVTRVNGALVSGMSGDAAIAHVHGPTGTTVRLTVVRKHRGAFTVSVKREQIAPITAYGRMLPRRLGYVQIFSFGDGTADQVRQAVTMLEQQRMRGIILDVRSNPGGYVDAAQNIVSEFLGSGVVAYEEQSNKRLSALPVLEGKQISRVPIAILVDSETASAAEITAAALRDNGRAVLIGTKTYGKGSMQSVYALGDGSSIRLTDRLWLTPHKQSISRLGLRPDIKVPVRVRAGNPNPDLQLTAAEHYLQKHASP
jgi:carboxyl-terminal processing protease